MHCNLWHHIRHIKVYIYGCILIILIEATKYRVSLTIRFMSFWLQTLPSLHTKSIWCPPQASPASKRVQNQTNHNEHMPITNNATYILILLLLLKKQKDIWTVIVCTSLTSNKEPQAHSGIPFSSSGLRSIMAQSTSTLMQAHDLALSYPFSLLIWIPRPCPLSWQKNEYKLLTKRHNPTHHACYIG